MQMVGHRDVRPVEQRRVAGMALHTSGESLVDGGFPVAWRLHGDDDEGRYTRCCIDEVVEGGVGEVAVGAHRSGHWATDEDDRVATTDLADAGDGVFKVVALFGEGDFITQIEETPTSASAKQVFPTIHDCCQSMRGRAQPGGGATRPPDSRASRRYVWTTAGGRSVVGLTRQPVAWRKRLRIGDVRRAPPPPCGYRCRNAGFVPRAGAGEVAVVDDLDAAVDEDADHAVRFGVQAGCAAGEVGSRDFGAVADPIRGTRPSETRCAGS